MSIKLTGWEGGGRTITRLEDTARQGPTFSSCQKEIQFKKEIKERITKIQKSPNKSKNSFKNHKIIIQLFDKKKNNNK